MATALVFIVLPATVSAVVLSILLHAGGLFDFRIFWRAGNEVLNGHSPWDAYGFRYPAPAALVFSAFAALPFAVAAAIYCSLNALAVVAILRILGVRDWRCYTISFALSPVFTGIIDGTISLWLALLAAVAWRYRDRRALSGIAIGLGIALKLLLWPLLVWLIVTRRYVSAAVAVTVGIGISLISWVIVGLGTFPQFVRVLDPDLGSGTYSLYALARALHLSSSGSTILMATALALLVAAGALTARRVDGDWKAFVLSIAGCLVANSFMHVHYMVLLLVLLAVSRPRMSPLWGAPLAYSLLAHPPGSGGSVPRLAGVLALTAVIVSLSAWREVAPSGVTRRIGTRSPGLEPT